MIPAPDPASVDPHEVARANLVESLASMVALSIEGGESEVWAALGSIDVIRITLAKVTGFDDFLEDVDAAERTLRLYLST